MIDPDLVRENIPTEMQRARRWLIWTAANGSKKPLYASGRPRYGALDSPDELSRLADFDTAVEAAVRHKSGLGFALGADGTGNYWQGIDFDHIDAHPVNQLLVEDLQGMTYTERSPSRNGWHAIGYGRNIRTASQSQQHGIEVYSGKRFFTVTGEDAGIHSPVDLFDFAETRLLPIVGAPSPLSDVTPHLQKKQMTQQSSSVSSVSSVGSAFIPEAIGQRNKRLFELARYLKGTKPHATKAELREIITDWYRQALPYIGTSDFSESWGDFQRAWESVQFPYGSVLNRILGEIDMNDDLPASLAQLGYGEKTILLCRICRQLQKNAGDDPFFISARQAGELIGLHFTDASKVLYALCADDVLQLVKRGAGNQASRYRYIFKDA